MTEGELYYLTEVLGVRGVVGSAEARVLASPADAPARPETLPPPAFYVYSPFALSEAEAAFVQKMVAAIGVSTPRYISQDAMKDLETFNREASGYGISLGLKPPELERVSWLELPAVSRFLDDSNPTLRDAAKRQAWETLKKLKGKVS